jgi:hypothetical protein
VKFLWADVQLKTMWEGESGWEAYEKYIAPPEGCVYPDKG